MSVLRWIRNRLVVPKKICTSHMKKLLHIIPILFLFPLSIWADGSCSIEQSPPSELTNYLNQVSAKLSKISTTASKKNNCDTFFKSEKKAFNGTLTSVNGLLDEVDLEMNLRNGISIDFLYNIKTSFDGTAREPVIRQGQVIHDIEDRITSTVKMVAASCNLDTPVAGIDGRKAGVILKEMISQNRKLEYYFKSVATGDLTPPDGVAPTD